MSAVMQVIAAEEAKSSSMAPVHKCMEQPGICQPPQHDLAVQ